MTKMVLFFSLCLGLIFNFLIYGQIQAQTQTTNTNQEKKEILVSAAMSLKEALTTMGENFEKKHPEAKLIFNFGASGLLRTQIENGAPADIFMPASSEDIEALVAKGVIPKKEIVAKNSLVMIANIKSTLAIKSVKDLAKEDVKKVAIGNPDTVPAGRYAKEALEHFKQYETIKAKLVLGENVRQVLDYVSKGEVDAGFVFVTDAKTDSNVKVVFPVPLSAHKAIIYPIGMIKSTKNEKLAQAFIDYVKSGEGKSVLKKLGFKI